jgi:5-hydroxyisourate hydrolase
MSQVTSHILDTTKGKPAEAVTVIIYHGENDEWAEIARAKTNCDGRVAELLDEKIKLMQGIYKMRFETKDYFDVQQVQTFYPYVEIIFEITGGEHYHIPLLLNPFGYTTYRGS